MAETLVDRCARSLFELNPPITGTDFATWEQVRTNPPIIQAYRDQVCAVLSALREPTDAMLGVGAEAETYDYRMLGEDGARTAWTDMIDAALEEAR